MNIADDLVAAFNDGYEQGKADAQKHGKWEERIDENEHPVFRRKWVCSSCGEWNAYGATKFCPNCGARMEV